MWSDKPPQANSVTFVAILRWSRCTFVRHYTYRGYQKQQQINDMAVNGSGMRYSTGAENQP